MNNLKITFLFFLIFQISWSQAPNKMSYQAVVRDADNNLVTNQQIGIKVSVLESTSNGNAVYEETHTTNSNMNGLVTLIVGDGTVLIGNFATINWSSNAHFIKTEIDINGGTNYTITGTQQLLSVPYAFHANTADNLGGIEGTEVGELLYWDGSEWLSISPGSDGQPLSMCFGVPTWGYCVKTEVTGPITPTTAILRGQIFSDGGNTLWQRGICYSTNPNPTIDDLVSSENAWQPGVYYKTLVNLTPNTTYYARAYGRNGIGPVYGNEVSFTTLDSDSIYHPGDYLEEEGGVVFYILQPDDEGYVENEDHGLIVSLDYIRSNQGGVDSSILWGCYGNFLDVTSTDLLSGANNTTSIINNCSETNCAAYKASTYISEGFDDWYLPSKDEIIQISINIESINGTLTNLGQTPLDDTLWSSSEIDADKAWKVDPNYGNSVERNKSWTGLFVRPIRTF